MRCSGMRNDLWMPRASITTGASLRLSRPGARPVTSSAVVGLPMRGVVARGRRRPTIGLPPHGESAAQSACAVRAHAGPHGHARDRGLRGGDAAGHGGARPGGPARAVPGAAPAGGDAVLPARVRGHPAAGRRRRATAVRCDRRRAERSRAERAHGRAGRGARCAALVAVKVSGRLGGEGRRRRRARCRGGLVARRRARAGPRRARPGVAGAAGARAPRSGGVGAGRAARCWWRSCASPTSPRSACRASCCAGSPAPPSIAAYERGADRGGCRGAGASRPTWRRSACCSCSSPISSSSAPRRPPATSPSRSRRASSRSTTTSCSGRPTRCSTATRCWPGRRRSTASPASTCWRPGSRSRRSATARSGC